MSRPTIAAALVLCLVTGCVTATPAELRARQHEALGRGDVLDGVRLGRARVRVAPGDAGARYDLACALARAGDTTEALEALAAAIELGFDAPGLLRRDGDLRALRAHPEFERLAARAAQLAREGLTLPGVRTVLREDLAAPLRLRLPEDGRRLRLAVWLHPAGARLNTEVERLAPTFLAHGFALAMPLELRSPGWTDDDLRHLLDESVPALAAEVDVERPLLIGLSAGSHAALAAWARAPGRFAGVVAGACAPELHGAVLPAGGAPVVIVNGARDPATTRWRTELPRWQREGRRVWLDVLPGLGHEFVFDAEVLGRALEHVR